MSDLRLCARVAFGLEASTKRELTKLGFTNIKAQDGRVDFDSDLRGIARANLWLRTANRVVIILGEFLAYSFDELFEQTKALPWGDWIPKDGAFTVTGASARSKLYSVPDCQAIVKKAVVEKLRKTYTEVEWFEETGPRYDVRVSLLKDLATITIDTTGPSLHMRGYRQASVRAPLKETLAAALIELSYWRPERTMLDCVCGSGTIPIEAALMARNIAPGTNRSFASQEWTQMEGIWEEERKRALDLADNSKPISIFGSDISREAVEAARHNAAAAGLGDDISFSICPVESLRLPTKDGIAIMNPPFGERMATASEAAKIYGAMGKVFTDDWSVYILTSDEDLEKHYGKKADKKRKLFNANIKTDYYQFHSKKPPR